MNEFGSVYDGKSTCMSIVILTNVPKDPSSVLFPLIVDFNSHNKYLH